MIHHSVNISTSSQSVTISRDKNYQSFYQLIIIVSIIAQIIIVSITQIFILLPWVIILQTLHKL
jgi:hypothetical protein